MDNERFNGSALQVRIYEQKETPHFMALFNGKIIIYKVKFKD
jgi:hypothetical protein